MRAIGARSINSIRIMKQLSIIATADEVAPSAFQINGHGTTLGFEEKLWTAADKMRGHMDPSEYKHIALGLIFLKYISDMFHENYQRFKNKTRVECEQPETYLKRRLFWLPANARWEKVTSGGKDLRKSLDNAMRTIERENETLKGVLPKDYSRSSIDEFRLRELIQLVGTIDLGSESARSQDIIGRVYEYFLLKFAGAEGNKGGEFYTPRSVVKLLVEMIEPFKGTVYDPCCGTAGMFVQSEKFIKEHGGQLRDIKLFGQESNPTTWRLAKMNLASRSLPADLGEQNADSFLRDLHFGLKADYILANPPFNMSYWGGEELTNDPRWRYGYPPTTNANFAWIQHMIFHLNPTGVAGFVLANGSMSTNTGGEGEIRRSIIQAGLVDCIVALPTQLFYGTSIAACLWFIRRGRKRLGNTRHNHTLFIDARTLGKSVDRTHKELPDEIIEKISRTYRAWRGIDSSLRYEDIPGFCKSAPVEEIRYHKWALVPGRYVGFDRDLYQTVDEATLSNEIREVEERLEKISRSSYIAIQHLRKLLHG
jgi:type I restriction enzyme M protein